MNQDRMDALARTVAATQTRRAVLGLAATLGLGDRIGGDAKKRKKKCKKCDICQRCKKGKCKPRPNDTACNGDGRCLSGMCNPRPTCKSQTTTCESDAECCSGDCNTEVDHLCIPTTEGDPCVSAAGCPSGLHCIGYVCTA